MFAEKVSVPFAEQETVITVDYERDLAYIYSSKRAMVEKLQKMVEENPDETSVEFDDCYGLQISVPIRWVSVKPPRKYSEEQLQKKREQLVLARQAKGGR